MPIEAAPNRIELSDFSGGFAPDPEQAGRGLTTSPDALNLLPDPGSLVPETRKGYVRLAAGRISSLTSHWVRHVNYYEYISSGSRKRHLICILSNGTDAAANNVQIWDYDLDNDTFARIDTVGTSWTHALTEHWYAVVQGVYYGGTRGAVMYSWDGATSTYDATAGTPDVRTWVDDVDAAIDTDTEYGRDFAFKEKTKVKYGSKWYSTAKSIRYDKWDNATTYRRGDKVTRGHAWGQSGSAAYYKSFVCLKQHDSSDGTTAPGSGASWTTYWKKIRLDDILDDDGEVKADWFFLPVAAKTAVGTFHGFRLWLRRDDEDDWARLQYSAPLRPEKDADIADLTFDPTDWQAVDDVDGDGGGWITMNWADGDAIRALKSYGNYLIICGRWQSNVLAGTNESTWTLRRLGDFGAVAPQAICEHEGLVYMLSPSGSLVVTDGTQMQEVGGIEKVREWLKAQLDDMLLGEDDKNWMPTVWSYARKVWISLPNPRGTDYTLVYDPRLQSFFALDLPILDSAVGAADRAQRMWFSTGYVSGGSPGVFQYADNPGTEVFYDDDRNLASATQSTSDIAWNWRTAWFQFGMTHNERRIRRSWALVRSDGDVTLKGYREFSDDEAFSVTRQGHDPTSFYEGKTLPDSHAVALEASGVGEAAVVGFGIDTEPRRTRFHRSP